MIELLIILATFGQFVGAADLDYDIQGNIFVVDRQGNMLAQYSPNGDSLRSVSGFGGGTLQFDGPTAVCARRGNDVYVADMNNHRIQRFNRQLDYITTISTRDDPDERKRFGYPRDVTVTRQGDLLVVDGENRRIVNINSTGRVERSFGALNDGAGRLLDPSQIETDDDDNIYVLDGERLLQFDPFGTFVRNIPLPIGLRPHAMSIDRDTLLLVDSTRISLYDIRRQSYIGVRTLVAPAVAARLYGGTILALEANRIRRYALMNEKDADSTMKPADSKTRPR